MAIKQLDMDRYGLQRVKHHNIECVYDHDDEMTYNGIICDSNNK